MSRSGLATRLYRGEAGINIIGKRKVWFGVVGAVLLIALVSFFARGFTAGIEFKGGTSITVSATAGTLDQVHQAVSDELAKVAPDARAGAGQHLGGSKPSYEIRTTPLTADQLTKVINGLVSDLHLKS